MKTKVNADLKFMFDIYFLMMEISQLICDVCIEYKEYHKLDMVQMKGNILIYLKV